MFIIYGNYDLKIGDSDETNTYGGYERNSTICSDTLPSEGEDGYVLQLKKDLWELGFRIVGRLKELKYLADEDFDPKKEFDPDTELTPDFNVIFDRNTQLAVREFQIYAKMNSTAQLQEDKTLKQVNIEENDRYSGAVNGSIVNKRTRELLELWKTNKWRCPVIIGAYEFNKKKNKPTSAYKIKVKVKKIKKNKEVKEEVIAKVPATNIWHFDDVDSTKPRMYAYDYSNYYGKYEDFPEGKKPFPKENPGNLPENVIGGYNIDLKNSPTFGGPEITPLYNHCWPNSEIFTENFIGELINKNNQRRSTYKVIRSVAEQECLGFFDSINAWDRAFISLGPCHWTLGRVSKKTRKVKTGELCGFFSYLQSIYSETSHKVLHFFGVRVDKEWSDSLGENNGAEVFNETNRNYTSWLSLQQENGSYQRMPMTEQAGNYFKSWHWIYRFAMSGRMFAPYRKAMWDMARIRLRDILSTPWEKGSATTIGDVYRSELSTALILRWHIYLPPHIVSGGQAGKILKNAFSFAKAASTLDWSLPNSEWTDAHEDDLISGLKGYIDLKIGGDLKNTTNKIIPWPEWKDAKVGNGRKYQLNITELLDPSNLEDNKHIKNNDFTKILRKKRTNGQFVLDISGLENIPQVSANKINVKELQKDLSDLGFKIVGNDDGSWGNKTRSAIREFQIYAKTDFVLKEEDGELKAHSNDKKYSGSLLGMTGKSDDVSLSTRKLIKHWVKEKWRCPVKVIAYSISSEGEREPINDKENLWLYNEKIDDKHQVYVTDYSGYYLESPKLEDLPTETEIAIGHYFNEGKGPRAINDQEQKYVHCNQEILPNSFFDSLPPLNESQAATFKIIRAVSEVRCVGYFDSTKAYGVSFLSFGCLDLLSLESKNKTSQKTFQLGAFLSYFRYAFPTAYSKLFEFFGLRSEKDWYEVFVPQVPKRPGAKVFKKKNRQYLDAWSLQSSTGDYEEGINDSDNSSKYRNIDYLRNWHWFYRWQMAARKTPWAQSLWQALWDFWRMQLKELLLTPWPTIEINGKNIPVSIGDIYTSEKAVALLFLWHLTYPQDIIATPSSSSSEGQAASRLKKAFIKASISAPIDTWDDTIETELIKGILDEINSGIPNYPSEFKEKARYVVNWSEWDEGAQNPRDFKLTPQDIYGSTSSATLNLASQRDSFKKLTKLDICNLPPSSVSLEVKSYGMSVGNAEKVVVFAGKNETFGTIALIEQDIESEEPKKVRSLILTKQTEEENIESGLTVPLLEEQVLEAKIDPNQQTTRFCRITDSQGEEQIIPIYSITEEPKQKQDWELNLSAFSSGNTPLDIEKGKFIYVPSTGSSDGQVRLEVTPKVKVLQGKLPKLTFAAAGDENAQSADFSSFLFDPERQSIKFDQVIDLSKFIGDKWPFILGASSTIPASLELSFVDGKLNASFLTNAISDLTFDLDLGSPLAKLILKGKFIFNLDTIEGLGIFPTDESPSINFFLDIFQFSDLDNAILNYIWDKIDKTQSNQELSTPLVELQTSNIPLDIIENEPLLAWSSSIAQINSIIFNSLENIKNINEKIRLASFSGMLPTLTDEQVVAQFYKLQEDQIKFVEEPEGALLNINLGLRIKGSKDNQTSKPLFEAKGIFSFKANSQYGFIQAVSGAFQISEEVYLEITGDQSTYNRGRALGKLVSAHFPPGMVLKFVTNPKNLSISIDKQKTKANTKAKIILSIPARSESEVNIGKPEKNRFSFEIEKFTLGNAGFDFKGSVRTELVEFENPEKTGFAQPLGIKSVEKNDEETAAVNQEPKVGEIEIRQSQLIYGSLQASTQLTYFDDARGTFTLIISQDEGEGLDVTGIFDISGITEFHVSPLFATFQIDNFQLSTSYSVNTSKWSSRGSINGRVLFAPPKGRLPSEMGELAELFQGITVAFEQLDPVQLANTGLTISLAEPKQFNFAEVFTIDLSGLVISPSPDLGPSKFKLLGNITIQELPGIDARLTFGGITLEVVKDKAPKFSVSRIAGGLTLAGDTQIDIDLNSINSAKDPNKPWILAEEGFGGSATIAINSLPELVGLIKLTRIKAKQDGRELWLPSLAIYLESKLNSTPLVAGFFLRRLGVGFGINQALRGLAATSYLNLSERVLRLIDDPKGLPQPDNLSSWEPNAPSTSSVPANWMLVANGLITLGELPDNKPHSLAGSILLAIDQDIEISAASNIWIFTSPNETLTPAFRERPLARAAIIISPQEQSLFAAARTLKNPKLGSGVPDLLGKVLNQLQVSMKLLADRNGYIEEIGWPWETKIAINLGPLRGELVSGYRFGIYRGVISYGHNFGVNVDLDERAEVGAQSRFGGVGVVLGAKGSGYFRCSFAGALTSSFTSYLLGDVRVNTSIKVFGKLYARFSKKIFGKRITLLSINTSFDANIHITAALTAAFVGAKPGFDGEVGVALKVGPFRLGGQVPVKLDERSIQIARNELARLMPALSSKSKFKTRQERLSIFNTKNLEALKAKNPENFDVRKAITNIKKKELKDHWNYYFYKVNNQIRILLFHCPDTTYPVPEDKGKIKPSESKQLWDELKTGQLSNTNSWRNRFREQFKTILTNEAKVLDNNPNIEYGDKYRDVCDGENGYYRIWKEYDNSLSVYFHSKEEYRFEIQLKKVEAFRGFLGKKSSIDDSKQKVFWEEDFEAIIKKGSDILEDRETEIEENNAFLRDLNLRLFLDALQDSRDNVPAEFGPAEEYRDPRTLNPTTADIDDETAGLLPEGVYSPNFKRNREYDELIDEACKLSDDYDDEEKIRRFEKEDRSEGLNSAILMGELRQLLLDTQSSENTESQNSSIAKHLKLILVFKLDDKKILNSEDPVPHLISTDECVMGGKKTKLVPYWESEKRPDTSEYSLLHGPTFMDKRFIGLTWDFQREKPKQNNNSEMQSIDKSNDIDYTYKELDRITITRTNLSQFKQPPIISEELPVWIDASQSEKAKALLKSENNIYTRPQLQFIDKQLQEVQEGDLLQYKIEAKALDRTLTSSLINVQYQTVKPLAPPTQSLFLHQLKKAKKTKLAQEDIYEYQSGKFEIAVLLTPPIEEEQNPNNQTSDSKLSVSNGVIKVPENDFDDFDEGIIAEVVVYRSNNTDFDNEFGLYWTDDENGSIETLLPDIDNKYAQNAVGAKRRLLNINTQLLDNEKPKSLKVKISKEEEIEGNFYKFSDRLYLNDVYKYLSDNIKYISPYLVQNSNTESFLRDNPENDVNRKPLVFFGFTNANPDKEKHLSIKQLEDNLLIFRWEDRTLPVESLTEEPDYNDVIVHIKFTSVVKSQLSLRYRFVEAPIFGHYGLNVLPGVKTQWNSGLVGQAKLQAKQNSFDIKFAESEQSSSIPWEETKILNLEKLDLEWQPIKNSNQTNQQSQTVGYKLEIEENELWKLLGFKTEQSEIINWPENEKRAIEFFIGREQEFRIFREQKQSLERSQLIRCRHALFLPESEDNRNLRKSKALRSSQKNVSEEVLKYFNRGNNVNAIELLPRKMPKPTFVPTGFIKKIQVNYGQFTVAEDESQNDVSLNIQWRYLQQVLSQSSFEKQKANNVINSVIGYRLHRSDEYLPSEYSPGSKKVKVNPELTIDVLPKSKYKSIPSTVEVLGKTIDNETEKEKKQIQADWVVVSSRDDELWSSKTIIEKPLELIEDECFPRGPIWLHDSIEIVLEAIEELLWEEEKDEKAKFTLQLHYPLEDRSSESLEPKLYTARVQKLIDDLSESRDPFGWWALEAIGFSCECQFLDQAGNSINPESLFFKPNFIQKLQEKLKDKNLPVSIALFLAEDSESLLNVWRIFYSGKTDKNEWPIIPGADDALNLRLNGRTSNLTIPFNEDGDLKKWLKNIVTRLKNSTKLLGDPTPPTNLKSGKIFIYQRRTLAEKMIKTAKVKLPFDDSGWISTRLEVGDRWAHKYLIALEVIRRYDAIWQSLLPRVTDITISAKTIPYELCKIAEVMRTKYLVPHNLVVTPLSGSVQGFVFAHPASFAATSSAVLANRGEFSGTKTLLLRRIDPEIQQLYSESMASEGNKNGSFPSINWELYRQWFTNWYRDWIQEIFSGPFQPPTIPLPDKDGKWPGPENVTVFDPFELVAGTKIGIYGADRYVYPDVPAYYQWSISAFSTAGLQRSQWKQTRFVSPFYESPKPLNNPDPDRKKPYPRQSPRTIGCRRIRFNETLLFRVIDNIEELVNRLNNAGEEGIAIPEEIKNKFPREINFSEKARIVSTQDQFRWIIYDPYDPENQQESPSPKFSITAEDIQRIISKATYKVNQLNINQPTQDGTNTLNFKIRLIHPHFYMPDQIGNLWLDIEEDFSISNESQIKFGILPDLSLSYQLYLWQNYDSDDEENLLIRQFLALATIEFASGSNSFNNEENGFELKVLQSGIEVINSASKLEKINENGVERYKIFVQQEEKDQDIRDLLEGELYFEFTLKINDLLLLRKLNSRDDRRQLLFLSVSRGGVSSISQPVITELKNLS